MPLDNLQKDITSLTAFNWGDELNVIIQNNTDALLTLQEEQMASGVDSNNNPTALDGDGYQPSTIEHKQKYGQGLGAITDRVTGYMTGALYAALEVAIDDDTFSVDSTVDYFPALLERTGEQWMGLNDDSKTQYAENVVAPAIAIIFEDKTGFKMTVE